MPNFFLKPQKIFDILRGEHKKIIAALSLIFIIVCFGVFVFGVGEARAGLLGSLIDVSFELIAKAIAYVGAFFKSIVSIFFWLASMILELAFGLEEFTDAVIVEIGWKITRDIANMLFVIGLIIIAGATALRIDAYDVKKLLPKLIIAALLINFSLVIAGVVIDFTQVATHFFYDEIETGKGITERVADSLNISKMPQLNVDAEIGEKLTAGISGLILLIFSMFLETILILAASVAIALGAFFLIIRVIILQILLVLAPLAWIMYILPATNHLFQNWWKTFLKWSFFAPIYAFFIYLSITATQRGAFVSFINERMEEIVLASNWKEMMGSALMSFPSMFMQFIIIVGFLFGGVIAANSMSIYGAKGAMGIARGWGKGAGDISKNWAKRKALRAGARPAGWAGRKLAATGNWIEQKKWIGKPGRPTVTSALTKQAGRGFRSIEEKERAAIAKEKEKYKGYTVDNLQRTSKAVDGRGRVAIGQLLAEKKAFKENEKTGYANKEMEQTIKISKRYGMEKDLLKARPELAADKTDSKEEAEKKISQSVSFKLSDLEKVQPESYKVSEADEKDPKRVVRQKVYREVLKKSIISKAKKTTQPSALPKLAASNPNLYIHVQENILKPIYQDKGKLEEFQRERSDMSNFVESDAGKALGVYKKPSSQLTEEQQAKAELEKKFGAVKAWRK